MEFLCVDFEQIANKKSSDECLRIFVVEHCPRQPNFQIVCSTAIQSSSAFRKEPFPQSLSS